MIGKTLGHYQITSQLGKGGMGEVYQAKDQKLGRDVAIKVLPEEFSKDADRLARFQREAKVLASLNHPNIAAIHGLEESDGTNFLVLELVEGETLANRIKAGPIPVEEALKLALQIAEALEGAHEKGVIHRDLKPANIKVTPDGKVKVLDFGLAKAYAGDREDVNLSNSPTLSDAATRQGVILGTAAYMSPEQARGKSVDKRTDIWAFGCVLYEMLTGRVAFQGEDVSEILASVIKGDVKLDLLPANIHPRVREVIIRCLQKDLTRRYRDIGDVRLEIEQALAEPGGVLAQPGAAQASRAKSRQMLLWAAITSALIIVAAMAAWNLKPPEARQITRFTYELPKNQQFGDLTEPVLAVSPDGRQFVYSLNEGLYLRSMDGLDAKLIPGTGDRPRKPFFSPDGKWIGYWSEADGQLKKIGVSGGVPIALTQDGTLGYLSWNSNDTIVYSDGYGIKRISANGGKPELILDQKKIPLGHTQILPDGKAILFTEAGTFQTAVKSLESGEWRELFTGDTARYLPTRHIVYGVGDILYAIPFDSEKLRVAGGPVAMVQQVFRAGGAPQFAVSDSGTLVYMLATEASAAIPRRTLVWVDRKGKEEPLAAAANAYSNPRISPDGTRAALTIEASGNQDIHVLDLAGKTPRRLTFDKVADTTPLWSPDGKRIVFASQRESSYGVLWKAADGMGEAEALAMVPGRLIIPCSWSRDGKTMFLMEWASVPPRFDVGALSMDGGRKYKTLLKERQNETQPKISPDGKWLAYVSDEEGRREIYVRPFPEVDKGRWQVSANGGDSPLWSPDGRELFYRSGDAVMAVSVQTAPAFSSETPRVLFRGMYTSYIAKVWSQIENNPWDISPDGRRFLIMKESEASTAESGATAPRKINVVLNWFEELKQRVPVK